MSRKKLMHKKLVATVVIVAVMVVGLIIYSRNRTDAACLANINAIMTAIKLYANDHDGVMPPSFDVLMKGDRYLSRDVNAHGVPHILVCPRAHAETVPSYRLQPLYKLKYPSVVGSNAVVLCEIRDNGHSFENVEGHADGTVITWSYKKPSLYVRVSAAFWPSGVAYEKARAPSCISNLKALSTAITMYSDDDPSGLPPKTWDDLLFSRPGYYLPLGSRAIFCPLASDQSVPSYTLRDLKGKPFQANATDILMYETKDNGHSLGVPVMYLDGWVEQIPASQRPTD
jgi:hypothetical protein